jgi:hypothetical protein
MKIPECTRVGVPPPLLSGIIESIEGLASTRHGSQNVSSGSRATCDDAYVSRLVFLLSCYMDTHFDEPVSTRFTSLLCHN